MTDMTDMGRPASDRHPWLDAILVDPSGEVQRLLYGMAAVYPYHRAEPQDAAAMIFAGLEPSDPAFSALENGLDTWFENARGQSPDDDFARELLVLKGIDAF